MLGIKGMVPEHYIVELLKMLFSLSLFLYIYRSFCHHLLFILSHMHIFFVLALAVILYIIAIRKYMKMKKIHDVGLQLRDQCNKAGTQIVFILLQLQIKLTILLGKICEVLTSLGQLIVHTVGVLTKISLISFLVAVATIILVCFGIMLFSTLCITSAATTRYMMLKDVPGSTVIPLSFNVLPLVTEWWRGEVIDRAIVHYLPQDSSQSSNNSLHVSTANYVMEHASDLKISLLQKYIDYIIATSTLLIPTSSESTLIFTSRGEVNYDKLFSNPTAPLFTTDGEYSATVQLVLLKEEVGSETALVLEYAMLYSDEEEWSLPTLKVLFASSHSVNVRTGPYERWLLRSLLNGLIEFIFYVPLRIYRFFYHVSLDYVNAPFPNIDHRSEISVVVPLYNRFTPPSLLRNQLRAINFTLFQQLGSGEQKKVRISRWMVHSSIQLTGIAYWLREYPFTSFIFLSSFYGATYFFALASLLALAALFFLWMKYKGESDEVEEEEEIAFVHTDSSSSSTSETPCAANSTGPFFEEMEQETAANSTSREGDCADLTKQVWKKKQ